MFSNLPVVRARIRPHGLLTKNNPCFMKILCNTKELQSAIREEDIMDYMLKQHILWRMLFEMQLGKRILDLVIQLLLLDKPYFAFTRTYRITRSWN